MFFIMDLIRAQGKLFQPESRDDFYGTSTYGNFTITKNECSEGDVINLKLLII